jgi:hypothetical protein
MRYGVLAFESQPLLLLNKVLGPIRWLEDVGSGLPCVALNLTKFYSWTVDRIRR